MRIPNTRRIRLTSPDGRLTATVVAVVPKGADFQAYLEDLQKRFDWKAWEQSLQKQFKVRVGQQKQRKQKRGR